MDEEDEKEDEERSAIGGEHNITDNDEDEDEKEDANR